MVSQADRYETEMKKKDEESTPLLDQAGDPSPSGTRNTHTEAAGPLTYQGARETLSGRKEYTNPRTGRTYINSGAHAKPRSYNIDLLLKVGTIRPSGFQAHATPTVNLPYGYERWHKIFIGTGSGDTAVMPELWAYWQVNRRHPYGELAPLKDLKTASSLHDYAAIYMATVANTRTLLALLELTSNPARDGYRSMYNVGKGAKRVRLKSVHNRLSALPVFQIFRNWALANSGIFAESDSDSDMNIIRLFDWQDIVANGSLVTQTTKHPSDITVADLVTGNAFQVESGDLWNKVVEYCEDSVAMLEGLKGPVNWKEDVEEIMNAFRQLDIPTGLPEPREGLTVNAAMVESILWSGTIGMHLDVNNATDKYRIEPQASVAVGGDLDDVIWTPRFRSGPNDLFWSGIGEEFLVVREEASEGYDFDNTTKFVSFGTTGRANDKLQSGLDNTKEQGYFVDHGMTYSYLEGWKKHSLKLGNADSNYWRAVISSPEIWQHPYRESLRVADTYFGSTSSMVVNPQRGLYEYIEDVAMFDISYGWLQNMAAEVNFPNALR